MISICIPVYNFDVRNLVTKLYSESKNLDVPIEIVVIDDASKISFRVINSEISTIANYIQLDKNIGRSKIRNLFLNYVKYEYLLFLDCDSIIVNDNFIKKYISSIDDKAKVIVGGRIYSSQKPEKNKFLRWKYCMIREQKPSSIKKRPFISNNFLIGKSLFEKIKFDERITNYGHEDTLFGYQLKKNGVAIKFIDNPILNGDLETNLEFLGKTKRSIENLKLIAEFENFDSRFINEVTLLKNYFLIRNIKIDFITGVLWKFFNKWIEYLLDGRFVNLFLFDFYKLGYLAFIMRSSNETETS